jgi:hypothetical protein
MASATFPAIHRCLLRLMMHKVSDGEKKRKKKLSKRKEKKGLAPCFSCKEPGKSPPSSLWSPLFWYRNPPGAGGCILTVPNLAPHALAGHLFPILDR